MQQITLCHEGFDIGFASRPPAHVEAAARFALQRAGISPPGVDQFLKGQVVLGATDRSRLATLGFQGGCANTADLLRLEISPPGAAQFLNGQVIASPADRARLASLYFHGFTPPIGSNKGSLRS